MGFEKYKTFLYKILETFNQFKKLQLKNNCYFIIKLIIIFSYDNIHTGVEI